MAKYALFAGHSCYPSGGWEDLVGCYISEDQAIDIGRQMLTEKEVDWFQVVCLSMEEIVHAEGYTLDKSYD